MPWKDNSISQLILEANKLLMKEFTIVSTSEVFICSRDELIIATKEELLENNLSPESLSYAEEVLLPSIIAKYFQKTNEIWLVNGLGTNSTTIIHEMLHAIQQCSGSREPIVDFISYKLTNNLAYIDDYNLENWSEIEKKNSFSSIKKRLLQPGDCEEF